MRIIKRLTVLIIFFMIIFLANNLCYAIGVQPMSHEFELSPGESTNFSLLLSPSDKDENVKLSIYKPIQDITGNISYKNAEEIDFPEANWLKIENNELTVEKGETFKVNGEIEVPFGASGSHVLILMVEPEASKAYNGVALKVRYAVRIIVRVKSASIKKEGKLTDLELIKDEQERQLIRTKVNNPSALDYKAKVELTIRDKNNRLIERMNLRTMPGHKNKKDVWRIYPESEVMFIGWPENFLAPGTYNLRAILNYGERGQNILKKTITIKEGVFENKAADGNIYFQVKPEEIKDKLKAGKRESNVVEIVNTHSEKIYLQTDLEEIEQGYQNSLVDWVKLYNYNYITELTPREVERFIRIVNVPAGAKSGGYYAVLDVKAFSDSEQQELLSEESRLLNCPVGDDFIREVETEEFSSLDLSLVLRNKGNIHLKPRVEFTILDQNEKKLESGNMKIVNKQFKYLLPDRKWKCKAELEQELQKGSYTFKIEVFDDDTSLLKESYKLNINK